MIGLDELQAAVARNIEAMGENGLQINEWLDANGIDPDAFLAFTQERIMQDFVRLVVASGGSGDPLLYYQSGFLHGFFTGYAVGQS